MSKHTYNQIFQNQQRSLVPATFKKAVISAVNPQNFTADVYFAENPQTVIRSIPLASHIVSTSVKVGDRCRVDLFDEKNPRDAVVAYLYGRKIS
jgi:hypothetical protein